MLVILEYFSESNIKDYHIKTPHITRQTLPIIIKSPQTLLLTFTHIYTATSFRRAVRKTIYTFYVGFFFFLRNTFIKTSK